MDDERIVALYRSRSEAAITETAAKYGGYLNHISYNILLSREDAQECVNDTYHDAWNSMPPHRPSILSTFLGKITRRISIDRWRKLNAEKRGGGELTLVPDELEDCVSGSGSVEDELLRRELVKLFNGLMKSSDLIDIIGEAAGEHIRDAKSTKKKALPRWAKWSGAMAACLILVVGIGSYLLPRMGGNSAPGGSAGEGHDEGSVFMSYAGPVFPLTLREENSAVSAERNITMDFAPWLPVWVSNEEQAAALTNETPTEQTIQVLYPFASNLRSLDETRPTLTIGNDTPDTKLYVGTYAGGFQGAWGYRAETGENPGSLNLQGFESWEGYRGLLADGAYLRKALGSYIDLSHIPVTVYEFTDAWGPEENDDAGIPNPTIRVVFEMDFDKSNVLSYNFNGGYFDSDNGVMGKSISICEEWERGYGTPYYLIVIGDDIQNLQYRGYVTGGWDTKKTVEAGVKINRTETSLEEALRQAANYNYQEIIDANNYFESDDEYGFELYYGLLKEHLVAHGILSENHMERYDDGSIEELDVVGVSRVCRIEAEITIPAGEGIIFNATFEKKPSFDFHCIVSDNKGVRGYDLVTELGSNLVLTRQTACLEDRGQIGIVRQNFGFDLANGIREVVLDLNNPHYYLEVKSPEAHE